MVRIFDFLGSLSSFHALFGGQELISNSSLRAVARYSLEGILGAGFTV